MEEDWSMEEDLNMGVKFSPSDEELIKEYLWMKLNNGLIHDGIIKELNIYDYEPWQLQSLAFNYGMYFFTPIRKKHSGGTRIDRLTNEGYWRASQSCSMVIDKNGCKIGTKRPLVYYVNDGTQKGIKTNWLMNEYMLIDQSHNLVVCWIHQKKSKENSTVNYYHGTSSCSNVNPSNQINLVSPNNHDFSIASSDHNFGQEIEVNPMVNDYPKYEDRSCAIENHLHEEGIIPMTNDFPNLNNHISIIEGLVDKEQVVHGMNNCSNFDNDSYTMEELFGEDTINNCSNSNNNSCNVEEFAGGDMMNNYSNTDNDTCTIEELFGKDTDNFMIEVKDGLVYVNQNGQTYALENFLKWAN